MRDITNFMTWWIQQVANIFTYIFNTLNSITFANTSILKVIINIMILSALIPVILTIAQSKTINNSMKEKRPRKEKQNDNKSK